MTHSEAVRHLASNRRVRGTIDFASDTDLTHVDFMLRQDLSRLSSIAIYQPCLGRSWRRFSDIRVHMLGKLLEIIDEQFDQFLSRFVISGGVGPG